MSAPEPPPAPPKPPSGTTGPGRPVVWLARHGETEWSRTLRHTGRTDIPLTPAGEREARLLREPLAAVRFDRVLSSPLGRARETCALAGLGDRAELDDDLLEWDYGDYEGRTTADIHNDRPDWLLWRDGCPAGESPADVGARADRVVADLLATDAAAADAGATIAVFAHGHLLRVLCARWLDLPPADGKLFGLGTGTLSRLGWEHDYRVIQRWNAPV
ncbi:MAG: histidine phosphatase family protein [Acidobacteria bacterium]|nr:MAG: histidine phosphatase family protein [Acidobacteriota bacterium]MCL4286598.1 histidine phosphatase family protein [Thermoleophilia bacterium]GIK78581.1 MAG: phosphoglycerate mutase [Actinomycetes bacterium]